MTALHRSVNRPSELKMRLAATQPLPLNLILATAFCDSCQYQHVSTISIRVHGQYTMRVHWALACLLLNDGNTIT